MILSAEHIDQPCSGMYTERIYDVTSPWNSKEWTWIKFTDEDGEWCGEFRGKYKGVAVSEKLGIVVVLTTDYMFILDINTFDVIEYDSHPSYVDITTSPNGVILLTDGYSIDIITKRKDGEIENMPLTYIPVNPDNLKFEEWDNNVLKISCCEFYNWENEIELYLDCDSMVWIENFKHMGLKIMNKKSSVLLLVGIPLVVGISLVIAFLFAAMLELPTNRGIGYSVLAFISIIGSLLFPIPGSIFSILGIKEAVKLRKCGEKNMGLPILIGMVNIVVSFVVAAFWLYVIFIGGAGV